MSTTFHALAPPLNPIDVNRLTCANRRYGRQADLRPDFCHGDRTGECHHVPAAAFEHAVKQIPARRWLGLTATPYRRDQLDDLIALQVGPVRHTITVGQVMQPIPG